MADPSHVGGKVDVSSHVDVVHLGNLVASEGSAAIPVLPEAQGQGEAAAMVTLTMEDLVSDDQGNVVFVNEAGLTEMGLVAGTGPVDNGIVDAHVTAAGVDVLGMAYYSFDSGVTLYLPSDIHLSILSHT